MSAYPDSIAEAEAKLALKQRKAEKITKAFEADCDEYLGESIITLSCELEQLLCNYEKFNEVLSEPELRRIAIDIINERL